MTFPSPPPSFSVPLKKADTGWTSRGPGAPPGAPPGEGGEVEAWEPTASDQVGSDFLLPREDGSSLFLLLLLLLPAYLTISLAVVFKNQTKVNQDETYINTSASTSFLLEIMETLARRLQTFLQCAAESRVLLFGQLDDYNESQEYFQNARGTSTHVVDSLDPSVLGTQKAFCFVDGGGEGEEDAYLATQAGLVTEFFFILFFTCIYMCRHSYLSICSLGIVAFTWCGTC